MKSKKSRIAAQYPAYLFLLINHPGFIKHSRCQPQGTHLQMLAEGNLSIYTYFPSQPLWALSEDSRDTSHNFPLLLVYFYPSCMNQSVTYCPTVQSLTLVKLLIPFDIFKKKNMTCSPTSKSDLNDLIMKYLMLSGQVDDISAWRIYKTSNLQSQVCTL